MGNVCGNNKNSAEEDINNRRKQMKNEMKLLLLGSGESGKSTFFKQIKILYDNGYDEDEVQHYKSSIYANVIQTIKILSEVCFKNNIEFKDPENKSRAQKIMDLADNDTSLLLNAHRKYTPEVADMIAKLWADEGIKTAFQKRYEYHIFDGAQYFFANLDRLKPPNYVPTNEDILHCRMKTTGIVECSFPYNNKTFKLIDVGGQRNERKKWIHCFEGVTAVIFVASLGDYDQKCYEDDITNRMNESMDLFDEVVNGNWFKEKTIMLVFNKIDIFKTKIAKTDLSCCFEDYDGGKNYDNASKFIEKKFLELNKFDPKRIHTFFTCATSTESVKNVFDQIQKLLVETQKPKN